MEDTKQGAENFLRTCPTTEFLHCTTTAILFPTAEFTYSYVGGGLSTTFKSKLFYLKLFVIHMWMYKYECTTK